MVTLVVGVIFALIAFQFVNAQILSYCTYPGCEYLATVAGIMAFVFVLSYFNAQLRVIVKTILRL